VADDAILAVKFIENIFDSPGCFSRVGMLIVHLLYLYLSVP
jgi:hypothetical protein